MSNKKSYHSICRWSFHSGKGGFVPGDIRGKWSGDQFTTVDCIKLIKDKIKPRLGDSIELGFEMHYDNEFNESNVAAIADALVDSGIYLAMTTPGAHSRFAYGGICSLDKAEFKAANEFGKKTVELTCGPLRKAWHKDVVPAFVIWNGSFGYDLATVAVKKMYENLKESIANLCKYEETLGGNLYFAIEPKPNEGHPAMLLPTVASAILFWYKLEKEYNISRLKKGVNKEFGHSEMIGLDLVYDTVEEIDNDACVHMHLNSQGYNDGIILGGPGKYDIDNGVRVNGMNIAVAGLIQESGYNRWMGHDMQPRAYDNVDQAIDRVVRSILSWEACAAAAEKLDRSALFTYLENRETAKAEDMIRNAVVFAQNTFNEMYA